MSDVKILEDLALKHLNRHPNDKSGSVLARMYRSFGDKETGEAIGRMCNVAEIMGLTVKREIKNWKGITRFADDYIIVDPDLPEHLYNRR